MKELYLSPDVELKKFDLRDVISTSPANGHGTNQNSEGPGEVIIDDPVEGQG